MPFDPQKHHRRSIRLKGYDYSRPGGYFVTIVTQGRESLFGTIRNDEMMLNTAGEMVLKWWREIPGKFPSVEIGTSVVMPNHFHGIILIQEPVGADLRVCPDEDLRVCPEENQHACPNEHTNQGEHVDSPLLSKPISHLGENVVSPPFSKPKISLSRIVQWFKTMTTNEYIRGVDQLGWEPFKGKLWQRNYYEHIIRDRVDWDRIHRYIESNPGNWVQDEENISRQT